MRETAKIVVFSNDSRSADKASGFLRERGYEVSCFASPKKAARHLRRSRADIVLLDLETNEISGTEIIRDAKAYNPEVSIILMGTEKAIEGNPNLLLSGGYEYVLKPVHDEVLLAAVEQRLNQQRIYRICSALGSTLDLGGTLDLILKTALREAAADHGAILLQDGAPGMLRVEAAYGLPGKTIGAVHDIGNDTVMRLVLENSEPVVFQGGFAKLFFAPDVASSAVSSSVYAPIRVNAKTAGLLNVNRVASANPFLQSELRMIEIIAMQAAMALANARAHQQALEQQKLDHELELARSIQQGLLPEPFPRRQRLSIEPRNMPAQLIGGDFYDYVELGPDRFGLAIGDVAGKGVPGALLMVRAISSLRLRINPDRSPGAVLELLNRDLALNSSRGLYVTAIYAVFDLRRQTLQFANAGHPCPILRLTGSENNVPRDNPTGIPLGIIEDSSFETAEVEFRPGDFALFYTDGITEARSLSNAEFSVDRLEGLIERQPPSVKDLVENIMAELTSFTAGRPQHDDLTLVAVGANPS